MPCYECSMLGYSMTCQECSRFAATTPVTPPSSPASDFVFSFNFTPSLETTFPALETPFKPDYFTPEAIRSRWNWPKLETTGFGEPSSKKSRFNWSEMNFPAAQHAFDSRATEYDDAHSSISEPESEIYSNCAVCSMVPYGAVCTNCDQIQTSKAIILATPPAAAWPVVNKIGNLEATKVPEEELLRSLDMELFEQINVPHELDEWGRRVYNDCGHRILYYQDSDGNTIMGYEAWYPSSVTGDYEEPDDLRAGRQIEDSAVDNEAQDPDYDDCGSPIVHCAEPEETTIVGGSEAWYLISVTGEYEEPASSGTDTQDNVSMIEFEQQRFTEFLAAQDEELPQFQSDRERIAAWIATSA